MMITSNSILSLERHSVLTSVVSVFWSIPPVPPVTYVINNHSEANIKYHYFTNSSAILLTSFYK